MTSALGSGSPAAFLSGLGGQATDTAMKAGSAVAAGTAATAAATKSGFMRWLPWLIGALLLLVLWNLLMNKPATPPPTPKAAVAPVPAPAPAPAAVIVVLPAKVYFDVGSAAVGMDSGKAIAAVADQIKKEGANVAITGYTDRTGELAKNEELAKQRGTAVRDALIAASVALLYLSGAERGDCRWTRFCGCVERRLERVQTSRRRDLSMRTR